MSCAPQANTLRRMTLHTNHMDLISLQDRYRELDDWLRSIAGEPEASAARACRMCYVRYDTKGCACGRNDWTLLTVVLIEIRQRLDDLLSQPTTTVANV